jgi:hypothetical protein
MAAKPRRTKEEAWKIPPEYAAMLDGDDTAFLLEHAEKRLSDSLDTNKIIVDKSTTFLTLSLSLVAALIGYYMDKRGDNKAFDAIQFAALAGAGYLFIVGVLFSVNIWNISSFCKICNCWNQYALFAYCNSANCSLRNNLNGNYRAFLGSWWLPNLAPSSQGILDYLKFQSNSNYGTCPYSVPKARNARFMFLKKRKICQESRDFRLSFLYPEPFGITERFEDLAIS